MKRYIELDDLDMPRIKGVRQNALISGLTVEEAVEATHALNSLLDYERLGLTPDEIMECVTFRDRVKIGYDLSIGEVFDALDAYAKQKRGKEVQK